MVSYGIAVVIAVVVGVVAAAIAFFLWNFLPAQGCGAEAWLR